MNTARTVALFLLLGVSPALPQAMVSVSGGGALAHACFVAALRSAQSGGPIRDGVQSCTVALNDPMSAEIRAATYDNRGVLYDAEKNYAAAWADYNAAIRINPRLGDAYLNRGVALIRLHKAQEALADIRNGVALGASLPQIGFYDLAVAEENLGHVVAAYYNYKLSEAADPSYAPTQKALKNFNVTVMRKSAAGPASPPAQPAAATPPDAVPPPAQPPPASPPVLAISAAAPVESVTVWGYQENPKGDGDPDAMTCRKPQPMPGSRLMGPPTCKPNGEWAALRKAGKDVTPDGRNIIDSEKALTLNPPVCLAAPPPGANNANQMSFSPTCF